jgi:hypothetical protein
MRREAQAGQPFNNVERDREPAGCSRVVIARGFAETKVAQFSIGSIGAMLFGLLLGFYFRLAPLTMDPVGPHQVLTRQRSAPILASSAEISPISLTIVPAERSSHSAIEAKRRNHARHAARVSRLTDPTETPVELAVESTSVSPGLSDGGGLHGSTPQ